MDSPRLVDHLVIGAGFAGLCLAIKLEEDGERDFVVVDRGSDVGGTWRDNTYPGAACDVPSQLYSYSFALNPEWSRSFSPQEEIQAYIRRVAEASGTLDRFVFDTTVHHATWDADAQRWLVETSSGTFSARTLLSCAGGLSEPRLPDIDGLEDFQGDVFHTARWDHDVDLTGKRVAVIGTGASAIQVVPAIAPTVGHLDLYQRTAPWVMPRNDRRYSRLEKAALKHVPGLQRLYRGLVYSSLEVRFPAFTWQPALLRYAQKAAEIHLARAVPDPELRAKVTPTYTMGCKRILLSNNYYPALCRDNVEVVTDAIAKVTGDAVVTRDGVERPIDVLVVATGFHAAEQPIAHQVTGPDGRTLAEAWSGTGMRAYRGVAVAGFPNFFMVPGPNTGLGHTSMVFMIESAVAYVLDAIRTMREQDLAVIELEQAVDAAYQRRLQRRMARTVWSTGGCSSWYVDEHGHNTTLWPRSTLTYRRLTRSFDAESYRTVRAADASARTEVPA